MKRRTFLQSLSFLFLPFVQTPPVPQSAYDGLVYTDSNGSTTATLAALGDRITNSSGVKYAA